MSPATKVTIDLRGLGHHSRTQRAMRPETLAVAGASAIAHQLEQVGGLRRSAAVPFLMSGITNTSELKEPSLLRMSGRLARRESLAKRSHESPCIEVMGNLVGASRDGRVLRNVDSHRDRLRG